MSIENVVLWYEKNVNYKLTKAFLNFLVKTGIVKEDIDLELLNLFLLEVYGNEFVKENNKFKIKSNRIPVIDNFKEEKKVEKKVEPVKKVEEKKKVEQKKKEQPKSNLKNITVTHKKADNKKGLRNKFKIEKIGGKRLKLVKL